MTRILLALLLLSLVVGIYSFRELGSQSTLPSSDQVLNECAVVNEANQEIISADVNYGEILLDFWGRGEAAELGLQFDPLNVKYRSDVELEHINLGCPFVDCIASIDEARFESADEAEWLLADDLVMGVVHNGTAKAYPIKIMNYHEIVNDQYGCERVIVTYCPLCNSSLAFVAPVISGQQAEFGITGRLYKTDLVMYDRVSFSMWSQIEGRVIVGNLADASPVLKRLQIDVIPWGLWRDAHEKTLVLSRPTTLWPMGNKPPQYSDPSRELFLRNYDRDPYPYYRTTHADTFGFITTDNRLKNKIDVIGVEVTGISKAYPVDVISEEGLIHDVIANTPLILFRDPNSEQIRIFKLPESSMVMEYDTEEQRLMSGSATWDLLGRSLTGDQGVLEPVVFMRSYWFAWAAFHPGTELFELDIDNN